MTNSVDSIALATYNALEKLLDTRCRDKVDYIKIKEYGYLWQH